MLLPSILAILTPILTGILLGVSGVMGLLAGGLGSGFVLAVFMANSGGAWDNAKKYIEEGNLGGKGSDAHKAAVVGDTVGDPFKDTSGPSTQYTHQTYEHGIHCDGGTYRIVELALMERNFFLYVLITGAYRLTVDVRQLVYSFCV